VIRGAGGASVSKSGDRPGSLTALPPASIARTANRYSVAVPRPALRHVARSGWSAATVIGAAPVGVPSARTRSTWLRRAPVSRQVTSMSWCAGEAHATVTSVGAGSASSSGAGAGASTSSPAAR
jgi:hypothetical protein